VFPLLLVLVTRTFAVLRILPLSPPTDEEHISYSMLFAVLFDINNLAPAMQQKTLLDLGQIYANRKSRDMGYNLSILTCFTSNHLFKINNNNLFT